jgi:glyoxylase I family protein
MAVNVDGVVALLWVYDMPTSVRFYRDVLGCEIVTTSPAMGEDYFHWAMLRLGKAQFMLNTIFDSNEDRVPQLNRAQAASSRDVWLYFDCPDVDAAYSELRSRNAAVEEPVITFYGMKQASLLDPDGYKLVFQSPAEK